VIAPRVIGVHSALIAETETKRQRAKHFWAAAFGLGPFAVSRGDRGAMIFVSLFTAQPQHLQVPILLSTRISRYGMSMSALPSAGSGHRRCRARGPFRADTVEKVFLGDEPNFLAPLMSFARGDVRDHIASHKTDHRPSYRR